MGAACTIDTGPRGPRPLLLSLSKQGRSVRHQAAAGRVPDGGRARGAGWRGEERAERAEGGAGCEEGGAEAGAGRDGAAAGGADGRDGRGGAGDCKGEGEDAGAAGVDAVTGLYRGSGGVAGRGGRRRAPRGGGSGWVPRKSRTRGRHRCYHQQ